MPLAVFAYRAIRDGTYPVFDDALIALRIHDVASTHPPTVGAGTLFGLISLEAGANHPGPLPFVLLAPVYAASGFHPVGLVVSLALYHGAFVVLIAHLARRIGGTGLLVVAMGAVLVLERSLGGEVFTRPWNPYLAVLPFLAFLVAVWATLVEPSGRSLPWAVLAGSLAVQAQVTFAAGVAVGGLLAGGAVGVRLVRARRAGRRLPLRPVLVATAVGLVGWALPLGQQVTAEDGNLGRLLRWALGGSGEGDAVGLARGSELVAHVVGRVPPPTVDLGPTAAEGFTGRPPPLAWVVLVAIVVLLVAVAAGVRTSRRSGLGAVLALAVLATGVLVAARATPEAAATPYQLIWLWVTGAFVLVVLGDAAVGAARARLATTHRPVDPRRAAVVASAVLVLLSLGALRETIDVPLVVQEDRYRPPIDATLAALDPAAGPHLVSCGGTSRLSLCGTLILALEAEDVRVVSDPHATPLYGPDVAWRFAGPDDVHPRLVVTTGRQVTSPAPDAELLSATTLDLLLPTSLPPGTTALPEEQAEIDAAAAALAAADVEVAPDRLDELRASRANEFDLVVDGRWFRGRTVQEWQDLIDEQPDRLVAGGGLRVLAAAGVLDDHPELLAHADALAAHPDRDAVWLLPPGPPLGPLT